MDDVFSDNAFDASQPDYRPETLPLDEIIRQAMHSSQQGLRVALPCSVVQVRGNQKVDLQPLLQARYLNASAATDLPIIANAPVCMPMGTGYSLKFPIAVGDTGLAIFCDRSLDNWAISDGSSTVNPEDFRAHDLMDAVFFPGLVPFSGQTEDKTSDFVMRNGSSVARLEQSGRFSFGNGTQELLDLVDQLIKNQVALLDALQNKTFTMTMLGPQPFLAATVTILASLQSSAKTIQSNLESIKG